MKEKGVIETTVDPQAKDPDEVSGMAESAMGEVCAIEAFISRQPRDPIDVLGGAEGGRRRERPWPETKSSFELAWELGH